MSHLDKQPQMDPNKTMCVVKHNGKEVGRIAATAPNAEAYISELVTYYKTGVTVDYEYNEHAGMLGALFGRKM